ncbi:hypothetical protein FIBSPDRAFT_890212 [Athelia psychrophila]|uniref:Uncharacterized protein n=1 Tax=Athelia psychrophila TaxID=1759441 RepID=A0A166L4Q6_9AGAM|nr:hypothetical protein FIBSPDRAFT_890212 [Fibularhizoctonia sp. CBS 109695]
MPSPARVALHQEITRLIARARCAVMQSSVIMQYDPLSQDLRPWHWPVNTKGEWLTPEALGLMQASSDRPEGFQAPCCVCPHRSGSTGDQECDITMDRDGYYVGEYVARMLANVPLDRLYNRPGLLVRKYDFNAAEPSSPASQSEPATIPFADGIRVQILATCLLGYNSRTQLTRLSTASLD